MSRRVCRFAEHYQGRHSPEDALWWLTHPDLRAPSGAAPPQELFLQAVDELHAFGLDAAAAALLEVVADLLQLDRRATLDALSAAGEPLNL